MVTGSKPMISLLTAMSIFFALVSGPAYGLSAIPDHSASSVQSVVLKHTKHFLVRNIVGQAHDHSATVSWDAPLGVYANQVVAYKVVVNFKNPSTNKRESTSPIVITDVSQRSTTVTGLMNGVWHDFTITAQSSTEWSAVNTNNVKNGGMVKPSGLPCVPTTVTPVPGNKRVTVKWNRPCNGGVTARFTVNAYIGSTLVATKPSIADNHIAPATTFTGLTNGTGYTFTVTSTNANGSVTSATSSPVVPYS